jgi:hypothetical protein
VLMIEAYPMMCAAHTNRSGSNIATAP